MMHADTLHTIYIIKHLHVSDAHMMHACILYIIKHLHVYDAHMMHADGHGKSGMQKKQESALEQGMVGGHFLCTVDPSCSLIFLLGSLVCERPMLCLCHQLRSRLCLQSHTEL